MTSKLANLVRQISTTAGNGNLTLITNTNGFQSFDSVFSHGATTDVFYYFISNSSAAEWEYGTGHLSNSTTLVRDTVIQSSNSNSIVTFTAGTQTIVNSIPQSLLTLLETVGGYNAQSTTYAPIAADLGVLVDFTGSSNAIWTMTSAVTLGNRWFCYLRNSGTSEAQLTLKSSSGTIDTIAAASGYIMYPGEVRKIMSDGTNFRTVVMHGFSIKFLSSTTFMVPPGYKSFGFDVWSSGQSGASRLTTGNAAGGAGGTYTPFLIPRAAFVTSGSTETITIGGTSTGVSGNTQGNARNLSSFTVSGVTLPAAIGQSDTVASSVANAVAASGGYLGPPQPVAGSSIGTYNTGEFGVQGGGVTAGNVGSTGYSAFCAGGGGGPATSTAGGIRTGGSSVLGGAGGAGGANTGASNGTNGTVPGGGGGGAVQGGTSGSGAAGQIIVRGIL